MRSSVGKLRLPFGDSYVQVQRLDEFDFSNTQIGLFSAGGSISEIYAPKAAEQGCVVIDNTSRFRYDDDVPLIVPEVNPHRLGDYEARNELEARDASLIDKITEQAALDIEQSFGPGLVTGRIKGHVVTATK